MALEPNSLEYQVFYILVILLLAAKLSFSAYLGRKIIKPGKRVNSLSILYLESLFSWFAYLYRDFYISFMTFILLHSIQQTS